MATDPTRRTVLASLGVVAIAGCTSTTDDDPQRNDEGSETPTGSGTATRATATPTATPTEDGLPEACPTTQNLDVDWPTDLDAASVESFVEEYEHVYYRDVVVEYEPESRVDSYGLDGGVTEGPRAVDGGYVLTYSGSGGVYRPTLHLGAQTADPPEGADVVSVEEFDDETVTDLIDEAASTGEAEAHIEPPGETVDRYIDLFASASEDFESLSSPGDSDTLYVDTDGTTVEVTVQADRFHGDYWWDARYYVDDHVVRRTTDEDTDPQEGTVLECRRST